MNGDSTVRKNVLVVEDEPDFRSLIGSILEAHGYEISEASSMREAMEILQTKTIDLITLDLRMPKANRKMRAYWFSGLHLYRQIKARDEFKEIPIIVVSGVMREDGDMNSLVRTFI